ncbi:hypothetical protein [Dickeya chrysanthemi]|uniref:hypothetical protein n=1 Tax=Dickeya chrysanthemi TaxID=556 RepID=UPI0012694DAB|nr:hypothetical protein [Dickeya chrysanthemi]
MEKLFRLKEWLTPEETARRLTTSFQEEISIVDCLQLALDRKIIISVLLKKRITLYLQSIQRTNQK